MYPQLYQFYMGLMLPKLASPCHVCGQEVRELVLFWNVDDQCSTQ